jgi:hypothetical protein
VSKSGQFLLKFGDEEETGRQKDKETRRQGDGEKEKPSDGFIGG